MDQIFPGFVKDADLAEVFTATTIAQRDHGRSRPWLMANMIMSADGAFAKEGRSGGLAGPGDKAMFQLLRKYADVILVGAGTARKERYKRPSSDEETATARKARGQDPVPRLAMVSGTGRFPEDQPFLSGDGPDPVVFLPAISQTDDAEPPQRLEGLEYQIGRAHV